MFLRPSVDMYLLLVLMVAGMDPVQVPTFSEKKEQTENTEKPLDLSENCVFFSVFSVFHFFQFSFWKSNPTLRVRIRKSIGRMPSPPTR